MKLVLAFFIFLSCNSILAAKSLTEQLREKAQQSSQKTPEKIAQVMKKSIEDLKNSEVMKKALKKGDKIPDFSLKDIHRGLVHSKDLLKKGPLIITFYSGLTLNKYPHSVLFM